MDKLDYKTFNSNNNDIAFSEENGYADPASEVETRKQLSYPLKEIKDFLSNTMPVNTSDNVVQLGVTSGNRIRYRATAGGSWTETAHDVPSGGSTGQVLKKTSSSDYATSWKDNTIDVITTAPVSAYTGGGVKIVYLTENPETKYDGYIYLIKEAE